MLHLWFLLVPLLECMAVGSMIWWLRQVRVRRRQFYESTQLLSSELSKPVLMQLTQGSGVAAPGSVQMALHASGGFSLGSSNPYPVDDSPVGEKVRWRDSQLQYKPTKEYDRVLTLLVMAATNHRFTEEELHFLPAHIKGSIILSYNDNLNEQQAREWFQRALELTY